MLLKRNDVNPDKADKWSRTPLARAAKNEYEEVVRMLLKENDVNPDKADKWSRTPLLWALENGYEGIAKLLQESTDLVPKYTARPEPTESLSPELSEPPEPPSKRTRRFLATKDKPQHFPLRLLDLSS